MAGNSGALDSDSRQIRLRHFCSPRELTEMVGCWGWIPTTDRWVMSLTGQCNSLLIRRLFHPSNRLF